MRWKIIVVLLVCLLSYPAYCQSTLVEISGIVVSTKGKPVSGATISIPEIPISVGTNPDGKFSITGLQEGSYTLIVFAMGFKTFYKTINTQTDTTNLLKLTLKEEIYELDGIVIVSDHKRQQDELATDVVQTESLKNQSVELNKILDQAAGIRVRQEGGLGSRVNYSINGLNGKAVRFFLDGIPMDYFGSSYSINTIPVSEIEKIEIYKGVVPVELGSDALGGAINVVTRKNLPNTAEVSYSYGSFNTHRAALMANYRNDSSGFTAKLSSFYNYSDNNYKIWGDKVYVTDPETYEIKRGIEVRRFHDSFESKAIKTDLGFTQKKWADKAFLGFLYSDMKKDIQHGTTMEVPYGEARYFQRMAMPYAIYTKYDLIKGLDLSVFSSFSSLVRQQTDTSRNIYNWYGEVEGTRTLGGERNRTLNKLTEQVFLNRLNVAYRINEKHKIGFNTVVSNLERTEKDPLLTKVNEGYWAPQIFNKYTSGLSFQSLLFKEKVTTSLFVKSFSYEAAIKTSEMKQGEKVYDTKHTAGSSIGYGASGSYQLSSCLLLNASFEKAYRLPEAGEILGDGITIVSSVNLKPETSENLNAGFKLKLFEPGPYQINLSGNVFYRNVTDMIQLWQFDQAAFIYINFEKVRVKGIDGRIQFKTKKGFEITNSTSFLNPVIKSSTDELGNENITSGTRLPNIPFFQNNTDFRLPFKDFIQNKSITFIYYNINYVESFYRYSEKVGKYSKDKIPSQLIHSFGAGYTFPNKKLTISFDINNLFNEQAFDNFAIQKPGRSAFIKINYKII